MRLREKARQFTANEKKFIFCFSVYISLMLYQTPVMQMGTITSFLSILLVIFVALAHRINTLFLRSSKPGQILLLFILVTTFISPFTGGIIPLKLIVQVLLFVILSGIHPSEEEIIIYRWVYCISCVVYSVLIIKSCMTASYRYYHGDVELFGSTFDPNFLCIPLVPALILLIDNCLKLKRLIISLLCFVVVFIAMVLTSSRGGFLSFAVSLSVILYSFLRRKKMKIFVKIIIAIIGVFVVIYGFRYLTINYNNAWIRMTDISINTDNGRFFRWKKALEIWFDSPIFGNGYGSTADLSLVVHNTFLTVLAENGLIGLILFLLFFGLLMARIIVHREPEYFSVFLSVLIQISLLSALDNRCMWVILCFLCLHSNATNIKNETK